MMDRQTSNTITLLMELQLIFLETVTSWAQVDKLLAQINLLRERAPTISTEGTPISVSCVIASV